MLSFSRAGATFAVLLMLAQPALAESPVGPDTVLARVNGTAITVGHLRAARDALPDQFRAMPADTLFQPLLEQLIEQQAVVARSSHLLTLDDDLALENEMRAFRANAILMRVLEQTVTDDGIARAYQAFVVEFEGREPAPEFNASHIIVSTEEEAAALRAELDAGADFAELAREHSMDGAAAGGGSLGWFGLGAMIPEFEEAVLALEVGDYMGPLETQFGWHLVLLNDRRLTTAPPLEEVREALIQNIEREAAQGHLSWAVEGAEVTRNAADLDPLAVLPLADLDD
ncbi:MAG: peptidylprolyl isomerase [Roseinatronobacter sp.]